MPRNYYEPPFQAFDGNSGTFWRCPHGVTRFSDEGGCKDCAKAAPVAFLRSKLNKWIRRFRR